MTLKINDIAVASPLPYTVVINDLDGETARNARGDMVRDRIAVKRSINLEWGVLTKQQVTQILNAVGNVFFPVQYDDPQLGVITKTFYVGNRDVPKIVDGTFYKGLSFNLIER